MQNLLHCAQGPHPKLPLPTAPARLHFEGRRGPTEEMGRGMGIDVGMGLGLCRGMDLPVTYGLQGVCDLIKNRWPAGGGGGGLRPSSGHRNQPRALKNGRTRPHNIINGSCTMVTLNAHRAGEVGGMAVQVPTSCRGDDAHCQPDSVALSLSPANRCPVGLHFMSWPMLCSLPLLPFLYLAVSAQPSAASPSRVRWAQPRSCAQS